jgi:hypothetical protein
MVATIGAATHLLLERQALLAAEDVERADRRVGIGTIQDHALGDLEAAGERDRIGRVPAGGEHRLDQLGPVADQRHVQRVARDAIGIDRDLGHAVQRRVMVALDPPPDHRQDAVGRREVQREAAARRRQQRAERPAQSTEASAHDFQRWSIPAAEPIVGRSWQRCKFPAPGIGSQHARAHFLRAGARAW